VANASFNQMPFHQPMVTRSPNHMWASSCSTTSATRSSSLRAELAGSVSSAASRNVTHPRFSMAPKAKSGSRRGRACRLVRLVEVLGVVTERVRAGFESKGGQMLLACGVDHAKGVPSTSTALVTSRGPTTKATR